MRIVYLEIENFRGIKSLAWAPSPGMNCLIGPGDSTKTTILDAIELCLNPRSYIFADDCDFFDLDIDHPVRITVTLASLPVDFKTEDRYGLHLRGWNYAAAKIEDEFGTGLRRRSPLRSSSTSRLKRAGRSTTIGSMRPKRTHRPVRYKDAKRFATNRLGPYAERHLGWGRTSVLTRIGEATEGYSLQLAAAGRAARTAFREADQSVFKKAVDRAEELSKLFAVPVRKKFRAELDVQGVSITSGGIALHDGSLPLRRLGTGSSRLLVAALQHDAGAPHIAIIDEIEHGLEPHRVARLLKYLKTPKGAAGTGQPQIFTTTHSPTVIRELTAPDIFAVRSEAGVTTVASVSTVAKDADTAQRHLRGTPEAFLARKVLVGEGRTEQGLARGLDAWWISKGRDLFALQATVVIDGGGKDSAPLIAEHLRDLGYTVFLLLDSDEPPNADAVKRAVDKGAMLAEWPDSCSTEERLFLDLPWAGVRALIAYAVEHVGQESVTAVVNNALAAEKLAAITDLTLLPGRDTPEFRRALGKAAKGKSKDRDKGWFKNISHGEKLAEIVGTHLNAIPATPLAQTVSTMRSWIDG